MYAHSFIHIKGGVDSKIFREDPLSLEAKYSHLVIFAAVAVFIHWLVSI